jgi:hypothetical protein
MGCLCRSTVKRVFRDLRGRRIPLPDAFDAALKIYRLHHPDVPKAWARRQISIWLDLTA